MPIHVICEGCESEFDVPETLAGKTIKCKSCGEGIAVVAKKAAPAKPTIAKPAAKKPVVVDDEDDVRPASKRAKRNFGVDGDDDDDDQPRSKSSKAPAAKKKSALPLILAGVLGFVVVGGGLGVYLSGMLDPKPEVVVNPPVNPMNDPRNQPNMDMGRTPKPGVDATDEPEKKPTKTDDTKASKPPTPKTPSTDKTDTTPADNGSAEDKPKAIIPVPIETKKPPMPANPPANAGGPRMTPDQFALTRVKNAAVYIECESNSGLASGSGWFGMEENLVFTNAHVLFMLAPNAPKPKKIEIFINPGTNQERKIPHSRIEILTVDRHADLAVLRVLNEKDLPTPLKIRPSSDLRDVEPIIVVGYPGGKILSDVSRSTRAPQVSTSLTNFSTNRTDDDGNLYTVQYKGAGGGGNSGGPVIDYDGNVIAVHVRGLTAATGLAGMISFGVPTEFVTGVVAGRLADIEYGQAYRKDGKIHIPVKVTCLDPFQRLKEVGIGCWVGDVSTKTRPAGKERTGMEVSDADFSSVKLDYKWTKEKQTASGELILPELQSGRAYFAQPYFSNALVSQYWMAGKTIKLSGPPVDLEEADLLVRYKTGSKRPISMFYTSNFVEFEVGEGEDLEDRPLFETEVKGLETVEKSNDSNAAAALRVVYDKFNIRYQRGEKKEDILRKLLPPAELNALTTNLKLVQGYAYVKKTGEIYKTLSDVRGAPPAFANIFKSLSDAAMESLEKTSVPLPESSRLKPGQTWPIQRPSRLILGVATSEPAGNGPPPGAGGGDPPAGGGMPPEAYQQPKGPRRVAKVNEYKYLEVLTYTYLGTRTRIGQKEAVIKVEGVIKPAAGSSSGATGTIKGYAYVDLDTGTLLETEIKKEIEVDTSRDGIKYVASGIGNFKVTRGSAQ
jgi:S1-C subfamily serine protease